MLKKGSGVVSPLGEMIKMGSGVVSPCGEIMQTGVGMISIHGEMKPKGVGTSLPHWERMRQIGGIVPPYREIALLSNFFVQKRSKQSNVIHFGSKVLFFLC